LEGYQQFKGENRIVKDGNSVLNRPIKAHLVYYKKRNEKDKGSAFHKYLKFLKIHNFVESSLVISKCHVKGVNGGWSDEEVDAPKEAIELLAEVKSGYDNMTAEQRRMAELEVRLSRMEGNEAYTEMESRVKELVSAEYERVLGKKPQWKKSVEAMEDEIKEFKAKNQE